MTSVICDAVKVNYGSFTLGPLSVELTAGITCLVGANGAGKSTFFRVAAGVERATSGRITVRDVDPSTGGRPTRTRPRVGLLPQDVLVPAHATVRQYLTYAAWLSGVHRRDRADAVDAALAAVGLAERADQPSGKLSGGMRRRLGLAQALVHNPDVLLLDEPTVGLDPVHRTKMRELVRSQSEGRVTVLATHLLEDVRALADTVVVLRSGQLVFHGDVTELERRAPDDGLGDTPLDRAVAQLMAVNEDEDGEAA